MGYLGTASKPKMGSLGYSLTPLIDLEPLLLDCLGTLNETLVLCIAYQRGDTVQHITKENCVQILILCQSNQACFAVSGEEQRRTFVSYYRIILFKLTNRIR